MMVSGKILDADSGQPLPGATVALIESVQMHCITTPCAPIEAVVGGTTTTPDGHFNINVAPHHRVRVSYVGYRTVYPLLGEGIDNEIRLEPDTYQLGEAVVTGTRSLPLYAKALIVLGVVILVGGVYYLVKDL